MSFLKSKYDEVVPYFRSAKRYYNATLRAPVQYKSTVVLDKGLDGNAWFHMKNSGDARDFVLLENRDMWDENLQCAKKGKVYQVGKIIE